MTAIAYLNGVWQAPEDARVGVLDRGFMFGDGIYEVIPVYHGKPFTVGRHLVRLGNSLAEVSMPNPHSDAEWASLIQEAVDRSELQTAYIYVQVTRGPAEVRKHDYPAKPVPTVLIMAYDAPILERTTITPLRMITLDDPRWSLGHIKTVSLIAAGMLKNEALRQGVDDAILFRDGRLTEATASNVFIVLDGVLITPPKSTHLLHGITRDLVLELAAANDVPFEEREVSKEELMRADEVMITSSGHETWPVGEVDGQPVGNGEGGVVWQRLDGLFQQFKND